MHLARHSLDPRLLALGMTDASALVLTFYLASFGIDAGVTSLDDDLPMRALLTRIYTHLHIYHDDMLRLNRTICAQRSGRKANNITSRPFFCHGERHFCYNFNDALCLLDFRKIVSIQTRVN